MDLKTLYREVILDHYKKPRNAGELDAPDRSAKCKNPSCGNRVLLQLQLQGERIAAVGLVGNGCAISQASASMMTVAVKGKTLAEAAAVNQEVRRMIVEGAEDLDTAMLGNLVTIQGVAKLHARVKCAMCGWSALEAALELKSDEVDLDLDASMPAAKRTGGM